jgi:hypothetical protein
LVWNPGVLRCSGEWRTDGPDLPLEFARTSRDKRLTLVLTPGARPVPALWTELDYPSPEQAQEALAGREGCELPLIGCWPGYTPRHRVGADAIGKWASERGLDAVLWTALSPKFGERIGHAPASAEEAVAYLLQLDAEARARAREYVERAPAQVQTTFRLALQTALGNPPI